MTTHTPAERQLINETLAFAQAWEQTRYWAYQSHLAGCAIGETFSQAVTFLTLTEGDAASSTDTSQHATSWESPWCR